MQYTIANGLDYQKAIVKFAVSYQQVYVWVRKYQAGNEDALKDNRVHKKPVDEHERLKLRIKELEARNEYLEMENAFAKKVVTDQATKYTLTFVRHVNLYQAIQELNEVKGYAITKLCALAGVARSAYYKWLQWTPSAREFVSQRSRASLWQAKRDTWVSPNAYSAKPKTKKEVQQKALLPNHVCSWTQGSHP